MSIMSKRIEMASGHYRALMEYNDIDNASSSYDSKFSLSIWHIEKPEVVQTIKIDDADLLYLSWLFEDIVGEMGVLKGTKAK